MPDPYRTTTNDLTFASGPTMTSGNHPACNGARIPRRFGLAGRYEAIQQHGYEASGSVKNRELDLRRFRKAKVDVDGTCTPHIEARRRDPKFSMAVPTTTTNDDAGLHAPKPPALCARTRQWYSVAYSSGVVIL